MNLVYILRLLYMLHRSNIILNQRSSRERERERALTVLEYYYIETESYGCISGDL